MILGVALCWPIHVHDVGVLGLIHRVDGVQLAVRHGLADVSILDRPVTGLLTLVVVH